MCTVSAQSNVSDLLRRIKPIDWIANNWNARDSLYCYDAFYNWSFKLQDNLSQEYLKIKTPEGLNIKMHSRVANKLGPHIAFRWFGWGYDFNFLMKSEGKKRNEFTFTLNSQIFNIDVIKRRTGGDFKISSFKTAHGDATHLLQDPKIGDEVSQSLTGVNLNYFINHKRFSNTAAYANSSIQIRSVGSPVVGAGFTKSVTEIGFMDRLEAEAEGYIEEQTGGLSVTNKEEFMASLRNYANSPALSSAMALNFSPTPERIRINDYHLQGGYAYNWVLSRRLLFSATLLLSPSLKWVKTDYNGSVWTRFYDSTLRPYLYMTTEEAMKEMETDSRELAEDILNLFHWYKEGIETYMLDDYVKQYGYTSFEDYYSKTKEKTEHTKALSLNSMARASITYNFNRWFAGVSANYNRYWYKHKGQQLDNYYWNTALFVGYNFGRRSKFRYDSPLRHQFVYGALKTKQIQAINDTLVEANLDAPLTTNEKKHTTNYQRDIFKINIEGCDLVKGPDGDFGSFVIDEGYLTPRNDCDNVINKGKTYLIDENGELQIDCGHYSSYQAANWWKKQLNRTQTSRQFYPEQLQYVLRGTLKLHLRGRVFGKREPVSIEFSDFYLAHGKDGVSFFLFGGKHFESHSTHSLSYTLNKDSIDYRLYIEAGKHDRTCNISVSRVNPFNSKWMAQVPNSRKLSHMGIPGTHDSGTSDMPESDLYWSAHTQNFPVIDQTLDGIRCFDIRLKEDMHFGHTFKCRSTFTQTLQLWDDFLSKNPSEFLIILVGSDEGGNRWSETMKQNFQQLIDAYPHRFVEDFSPNSSIENFRGKILVIRRQEECPYGKLLTFQDNTVFQYDCFHVSDVYKEYKTKKKAALVEKHIRQSFEETDDNLLYITFNSVAWGPRHHSPYQYAYGGTRIRKPLNAALYETIELKDYAEFGVVMLDFYNNHGESSKLVDAIIQSNIH